jgi:hypothetical protein
MNYCPQEARLTLVQKMRIHHFNRTEAIAFLLVSIIYLTIMVPAPGWALPDALADDGLFMKWSVYILNGQWLGPWDILTISKGPLHSLMAAAASSIGINPYAYKRIFYLTGSLIFVATGLNKAPTWLKLLTLLTLLLDPFQYSSVGLRNLREGTYIPLQLIAFGLGSWSLDQLRDQGRIRSILVAAVIGTVTCFGLILITREARMVAWIELSCWLFFGLFLAAKRHKQQLSRHLRLKILAGLLSVFAIIGWANIPIIAIGALNYSYYGTNIANSFEEGLFPTLNGKLLSISIKGESFIPRVHVRQSTIKALINEADPSGPLRKILKNIDTGWGIYSCELYTQTCGEIGGGWFTWALRYGIGKSLDTGANEASFQRIIKNANTELYNICKKTSILVCSTAKAGYLPAMNKLGFPNPVEVSAAEASRIASLVFIPAADPLRERGNQHSKQLQLPAESPPSVVERTLGIKRLKKSELLKWQKIFVAASSLGAAGKWTLIALTVASACLASARVRLLRSWDPVVPWILLSLCTHLAVYTLLGLTSFPGETYVIMASPLLICLLARLSSFLIPLSRMNSLILASTQDILSP